MPRAHGSGDSEVFVMVQIRRKAHEAEGSSTIGRRVGGEIETVGVAPVPDNERVQTPKQSWNAAK
jgi:hypothetical protein